MNSSNLQAARELNKKLNRYLWLAKKLDSINTEIENLEIDPRLISSWEMSSTDGPPRSATGRIKRGHLDRVFPKIASELSYDQNYSVAELRQIVASAIKFPGVATNTIQALADRLVKKGIMEITDTMPKKYKIKQSKNP